MLSPWRVRALSDSHDVPDPRRLSVPEFNLSENPTRDQLVRALSDAVFSISENLRFLRADSQSRSSSADANAAAIRRLEVRVDELERRANEKNKS